MGAVPAALDDLQTRLDQCHILYSATSKPAPTRVCMTLAARTQLMGCGWQDKCKTRCVVSVPVESAPGACWACWACWAYRAVGIPCRRASRSTCAPCPCPYPCPCTPGPQVRTCAATAHAVWAHTAPDAVLQWPEGVAAPVPCWNDSGCSRFGCARLCKRALPSIMTIPLIGTAGMLLMPPPFRATVCAPLLCPLSTYLGEDLGEFLTSRSSIRVFRKTSAVFGGGGGGRL